MENDTESPRAVRVLFRTGQTAEFWATDETLTQIVTDMRHEKRIGSYAGWPTMHVHAYPPRSIVLSLPEILFIG